MDNVVTQLNVFVLHFRVVKATVNGEIKLFAIILIYSFRFLLELSCIGLTVKRTHNNKEKCKIEGFSRFFEVRKVILISKRNVSKDRRGLQIFVYQFYQKKKKQKKRFISRER